MVDAPLPRTADQWADANRILPVGSAEPGPWRSARTPYTIGPMRAFSVPGIQKIIWITATQMGKSALIQNVIGARLDDDPAPIILIAPTQSMVDNVVEPKIMDMLRTAESLFSKMVKGRKTTKHHKRISGVSLRLAWAGSETEMSSDSAAVAIIDELDRMGNHSSGDGSVIKQAESRTGVYPDGKVGITSTPKIGHVEVVVDAETGISHWKVEPKENITSPIWLAWQEGSRHEWSVPCPDCGEYFIPRFSLLWWPKNCDSKTAKKEARLTCDKCGALIKDEKRQWMNKRGVFVSPGQRPIKYNNGDDSVELLSSGKHYTIEFGDAVMKEGESKASYWVSGLCSFSPKKTYGFLASEWLDAITSGDPERIQGVVNLDFGELYRIKGIAPEWSQVMNCAMEGLGPGQVPDWVRLITAGVDVHPSRIDYIIRGWGQGMSSCLLEENILVGPTDQYDVWIQLADVLQSSWGGLPIVRMGIDSGYRTQWVYDFCMVNPVAIPMKGRATLEKPFRPVLIDYDKKGKTIKNGIKLWHFNTDTAKTFVHGRIVWMNQQLENVPVDARKKYISEIASQSGSFVLYDEVSVDYCKQIVAEQRVTKPSGAVTWIELGANHKLDCEGMAYIVARTLGAGRRSEQMKATPKTTEKPRRIKRPAKKQRKRSQGLDIWS